MEYKSLKAWKEHDLLGNPDAIAHISVFWLSPQFVLMGIMDGLALYGIGDFFYVSGSRVNKEEVCTRTHRSSDWMGKNSEHRVYYDIRRGGHV